MFIGTALNPERETKEVRKFTLPSFTCKHLIDGECSIGFCAKDARHKKCCFECEDLQDCIISYLFSDEEDEWVCSLILNYKEEET